MGKLEVVSHVINTLRVSGAAHGWISLFEMAVWREERNASFEAVLNPIGRDKLICSGRGEPRSLVRRDWTFSSPSYWEPYRDLA